jgi:microcystin-dependent protein
MPYVGEIRMFAGNFAPSGWELCNGQLLPINDNEALFQLIGTTYGGDGNSTFAMPDLRGRVTLHQGGAFALGEAGGVEEVALTVQQIPTHNHALVATKSAGTDSSPAGRVLATSAATKIYRESAANQGMSGQMIGSAGGSQPHSNLQPFLCIHFIIAKSNTFDFPTS